MARNEAQTRLDLIDPKLYKSGWQGHLKVEYAFTDGRLIGGNKRAKPKFADYLLYYLNENLAIVEAKAEHLHPTEGLEQVKEYAAILKIEWVYSTNGHRIYEFNVLEGKGDYIEAFPSPEELYQRINGNKPQARKEIISESYYSADGKTPRYYQELAINAAIEAISNNNKRILLTLATGTGKTFISFQLVQKLYNAHWNVDGTKRRPKVLFLADRNILADQAINTFNSMEKDLVKINGDEIRARNGKVPTHCNIYFAIYQAIAEKENIGGYYKQYPKDFFDLIVIDECHRGSANSEGSWRKILDHFENAVHLGLTATPKRDDNVDTYKYFGKPVYEYSLKDGINDGFLSPYKVKRFKTNMEEYSYEAGDKVIQGEIDQEKAYQRKEYGKTINILDEIELAAQTVLNDINPLDKTIVFCADQEHALEVRDAFNKFKSIKDADYCVRVTSDEGDIGRKHLEHFQDNDKTMPVILTSSMMLTTGVDARNVRNIVLLREINSMVEFKQIIGRGTRLYDGKDFFTIIDFTDSTQHFYDEDWDGLPEEEVVVDIEEEKEKKERKKREPKTKVEEEEVDYIPKKVTVRLSDQRTITIAESETKYILGDDKPISAAELLEYIMGFLPDLYKNEEQLKEIWANPETRKTAFQFFAAKNVESEHLEALKQIIDAKNCDIFDILIHLSFNKELMSRSQRAATVYNNSQFFEVYKDIQAQDFLKFILERYEQDGIEELEGEKLSRLVELYKTDINQLIKAFGSPENLRKAFEQLQEEIYKAS